jgi:hypothetical protein
MRKTLALVFILATALYGCIRSQSMTPAPAQLSEAQAQSEGENKLLRADYLCLYR